MQYNHLPGIAVVLYGTAWLIDGATLDTRTHADRYTLPTAVLCQPLGTVTAGHAALHRLTAAELPHVRAGALTGTRALAERLAPTALHRWGRNSKGELLRPTLCPRSPISNCLI